MESLFQSGVVTEASSACSTAYLLSKSEDFLMTEYKVLKTKASAGLIKCSKLLYNGKVKLIYFTNGLKPLNALWNSMDDDSCIRILTNLFSTVIELKNNGFLNCHNLVILDDKIFVDANTLSVHLIYLPVNNANWDIAAFESDLRARVIKALSSNNKLVSGQMNEFGSLLSNGLLSMEEIYRHMCGMCKGGNHRAMQHEERTGVQNNANTYMQPQSGASITAVQLVSMDNANPITLTIDKAEYKIGKNPNLVDGAITYNKAISRIHCVINIQQGAVYITDLDSANGTFVNQMRLAKEQPTPIKDGDVVRLANSNFKIKIGGV